MAETSPILAMLLRFACPSCGQHVSATRAQIGITGRCPNCNVAIAVPKTSTLPTPAPWPLVRFACPSCRQHISATHAQIGVTAPCPNCNAAVTVPNASTLPPSLPPSPQPQQSPPAANTATARNRRKSEFLGKGASRPMLIIGIIALVALLIFAASQHSSSPGKPAVKARAALTGSAVVIT